MIHFTNTVNDISLIFNYPSKNAHFTANRQCIGWSTESETNHVVYRD